MKPFRFVLLLAIASSAIAAEPPRSIYPNDFKPAECAAATPCESFTNVSFEGAANAFLLRTLDPKWNDAHRDEMMAVAQSYCPKRATCLVSPGRDYWFCNDVFAQELREACNGKFDAKTSARDNEQCHTWMDVYATGIDQRGSKDLEALKECITSIASAEAGKVHKMDWWTIPATIPLDYTGALQVFAIDHDTHVPVQGVISFAEQNIFTKDAPTGRPTTYYTFVWPRKLVRIANAQGHDDVVPATMTITAPGYETVNTPVPTVVPKMVVTMAPAKLHKGRNKVTVTAIDADTKQPVEAQVYANEETIGFTNQPIEITIGNKRPEIWVRSPYDAYSDTVVK